MIWSLLKVVVFVGVVVALTFGASWVLQSQGGIQVTLGATEYTLGPLASLIAVVLFVLLVWLIIWLAGLLVGVLRFINGDETAVSRHFAGRRREKGYEALADGMLAIASGDGDSARSSASRADKYLDRPHMTALLQAQAAELSGDRRAAEEEYKKLLGHDETRFVGVRGLLKQKLDAGDTDTALKLAEKAFELRPRHEETQDVLLRLQADHHDWAGARKTLGAKLKHGSMPRDLHRRRDAVLALSEARDVFVDDASIEAREAAIEANRLSPDLVPAAVLAARGYLQQGKPRYAARVVKKAWQAQPHPDLAAAFAEIKPDEAPDKRVKRFQELTRLNTGHPETKMLLAELNIASEDFPAARRALGDLADKDPTARTLAIMAAIERGEGADDAVVRGWLARAVTAPRGPQWCCDKCQNIHAVWAPTCRNCGAFDTLTWRKPKIGDEAMPHSAEMLPLLVGRPEAPRRDVVVMDDPAPELVPDEAGRVAATPTDPPTETTSEAHEAERVSRENGAAGSGQDQTAPPAEGEPAETDARR